MRPLLKPSGTSAKRFTRRLCANKKLSMRRKSALRLRKTGKSVKSNAKRTERIELGGESGRNKDVLSVSVCVRNNGNLMSKGSGNETRDTSDVAEKNVRGTGIGGAVAVAVAVGLEIETGIGNENENGIAIVIGSVNATETEIGIATGLVTAPQPVVLSVPCQSDLVTRREVRC